MPARASRAESQVPGRFTGTCRLPQDEIARVLLRIAVRIHARAGSEPFSVEPRQASVVLECRDPEVDGPVAAIGMPAGFERANEVRHGFQIRWISRARLLFNRLQPQGPGILLKRPDVLIGIFAKGHAGLLRSGNGLVVHVREVHHLVHAQPQVVPERTAEHVEDHECPEIADVTAVVNGETARVDTDRRVGRLRKRLFAPRQGVVENHQSASAPVWHIPARRPPGLPGRTDRRTICLRSLARPAGPGPSGRRSGCPPDRR